MKGAIKVFSPKRCTSKLCRRFFCHLLFSYMCLKRSLEIFTTAHMCTESFYMCICAQQGKQGIMGGGKALVSVPRRCSCRADNCSQMSSGLMRPNQTASKSSDANNTRRPSKTQPGCPSGIHQRPHTVSDRKISQEEIYSSMICSWKDILDEIKI